MTAADLNRRAALQVFIAGGSAALLAGCGASGTAPPSSPAGSSISLTDQRGKTLSFARPVARVVTIPMASASLLVAVDRSADHLAAMHNASWVAMRDGIMGAM